MALITIVDNTTGTASDMNNNNSYMESHVLQVYTGSAFNTSATKSSAGTDTQTNSYEFNDISAASLVEKNYIEITVNTDTTLNGRGQVATCTLTMSSKYLTGAYVDEPAITIGSDNHSNTITATHSNSTSLRYFIAVTANMKINGAKIKISTTSSVTYDSGSTSCNINNIQTILRATS